MHTITLTDDELEFFKGRLAEPLGRMRRDRDLVERALAGEPLEWLLRLTLPETVRGGVNDNYNIIPEQAREWLKCCDRAEEMAAKFGLDVPVEPVP